ncbi:MAG: TonB-dependent receptor [Acidobacteria bacterium]|nr:TonB-dependent receptor [Acidobacteriota bacterium]
MRRLLAILLLFGTYPLTLSAQFRTSGIFGRASDTSSAAIANAQVTLRRASVGFEKSAVTGEQGDFAFEQLPQGEYSLSISAEGFSTITRQIKLATGERATSNVTLQLGPFLEEITVTATHLAGTAEAVNRIPGSVEIIDKETLSSSHAFNFSEALRKVGGVSVRDEEGFGLRPNIGIRGLNPTRSTKVLLLEDGIPLTYAPYGDNASYYHPPIERFESIEVLKGSGQVLYGPVTVGGVVNYVTPAPPARPSGSLTLLGGNRDYFNGNINYGGTWGGTGMLLNYTRKQGAGARDNVRSGLNDASLKMVQTLSQRQTLTLKGSYYGEDSNVTYSGLREDEYRANPRQNPFRNDFFYGDRYGASLAHTYLLRNDVMLSTSLYGSSFKRHWWRQSSNSSQRPNDSGDPKCGGMANLNATCGNEGRLRQYTHWGLEPRLRFGQRWLGIKSETDLGFRLHFENQDRQQQNGDTPTTRSGVLVENNERKNQAYSAFLQNRFIFGDLTITPGVRVERIQFERTNRLANAGQGITGNTALTQWVPGIGVAYNLGSKSTFFAGVHRGFAPPRTEDVINNTTGGAVELDPELSWNYEVGMRSLAHPGVQLETTFFRMDYENQIIPASLAGGVGAVLTNGGATLHQGVELSGRIDTGTLRHSTHNIYFRLAGTYIPTAEFRGTRFSSVAGFNSVSITGNRLPYAPEKLLNASLGYAHPRGFNAMLEAVSADRQFGDDLNTVAPSADGQRGLVPGYTIWNATFNYQVESLKTNFFLTVKNLTDKLYIVDRSRGILPSSPRLIQGGLTFRF